MRFKKRSKVEVLSQKEAPAGAWRCAVIVSGNGHAYSVSDDWSGKDSQADMQRVSRKGIRPCPPHAQRVESWAVGDVAELFDDGFWKMATVLKVLDENYYLARLLGSSDDLKVHKYRIRACQLWNNDRWVVIGKGPDNQMSSQVPQMNAKIKLPSGNDCLPPMYNISCQDSRSVSSGLLKRASPDSSSIEGYSRKVRAIEKGCERQRVFAGSPSYLLKKVDAVAYPRENLGEKYMHTSFLNRTTGCFEKEREKLNGVISCFVERSSELNDSNSDACSVGSCSVINSSSNKLPGHLAGTSQDADTLSSDAETFCCCEDAQENFSLPLKEDVAAGIHRLELNAYRSTLVAMHASGSLSWEQEALLTNLRISLHISNDEHLMEPKNKDKASSLKEQHLRYFTPREVANLHSLPEDFQFPQHISLRQRFCIAGEQFEYSSGCSVTHTYLPDHRDYSKTPQCSRCRSHRHLYCSMLYESFQCRRARIHNFVKLVPIWFGILSDLSAEEFYNCTLFSTFFLRFSCACLTVNSRKRTQFFFHDNV